MGCVLSSGGHGFRNGFLESGARPCTAITRGCAWLFSFGHDAGLYERPVLRLALRLVKCSDCSSLQPLGLVRTRRSYSAIRSPASTLRSQNLHTVCITPPELKCKLQLASARITMCPL
ncbi:hypothetical protein CERSUDRAFT_111542, partial [Gelatoporia subvermispora B]